ncbi:MAG: metallophosphoesterase [Clostridia bacterium]|nr:metallophosphoesterase [Clostridia bacterium]
MDVLNFIKHVIATVLTLIMLPVTFMMPPTDSYEAKDADNLITSFTVLSDIHIEGNNYPTFREFSEILKEVHNAEDNDTLVFLGDNTMNCQDIESIFFYGALKAAKPADNLVIVPGNHDFGNGTGDYEMYRDRFLKYANFAGADIDSPYFYKVIDGCYFIVLSTESDTVNDMNISDAQLQWLKGVLDEAAKTDRPIFVFNHHPINYIQNGEYTRLSDVIDDYDNLLYFCGHTHAPLSSSSVSVVNGVQQINIPKSTEHATEGYECGIGAVVEVYDGEVLLRIRDFDDGKWVEGYEYSYKY